MVVRKEVVFVGSRSLELLEEHWRKGEWWERGSGEIVREVEICGGGGEVEDEEGRRRERVSENFGREKTGAGKKTKARKKYHPEILRASFKITRL